MSTHNIGFHGEIRKISIIWIETKDLIKSYVFDTTTLIKMELPVMVSHSSNTAPDKKSRPSRAI